MKAHSCWIHTGDDRMRPMKSDTLIFMSNGEATLA